MSCCCVSVAVLLRESVGLVFFRGRLVMRRVGGWLIEVGSVFVGFLLEG